MRAKSAGLLSDVQGAKSNTGSGGLDETYPRLYAVYSLTTGRWTLLRHAFRQSRPILTIAKGRSSQTIAKGFP